MRKGIKIAAFAVRQVDGKNFPIDQYDVQDFNLNDCGFPLNDIDKFERAQNASVREMLLKRMAKVSNAKFDNRPTEEILATVTPNGCQSPAEVARFQSRLAQHYKDKLDARAASKAESARLAAVKAAADETARRDALQAEIAASLKKLSESKSK